MTAYRASTGAQQGTVRPSGPRVWWVRATCRARPVGDRESKALRCCL